MTETVFNSINDTKNRLSIFIEKTSYFIINREFVYNNRIQWGCVLSIISIFDFYSKKNDDEKDESQGFYCYTTC
jgi:hypothetical protein